MEDALTDLKTMGEDAARREWEYRKAKAIAYLKAKGSNAQAREAEALMTEVKAGDTKITVADLGLRRDLAENAYRDQRIIIETLSTEAKLLQTMVVSGRAIDPPPRHREPAYASR
jgi:hypothetical protein